MATTTSTVNIEKQNKYKVQYLVYRVKSKSDSQNSQTNHNNSELIKNLIKQRGVLLFSQKQTKYFQQLNFTDTYIYFIQGKHLQYFLKVKKQKYQKINGLIQLLEIDDDYHNINDVNNVRLNPYGEMGNKNSILESLKKLVKNDKKLYQYYVDIEVILKLSQTSKKSLGCDFKFLFEESQKNIQKIKQFYGHKLRDIISYPQSMNKKVDTVEKDYILAKKSQKQTKKSSDTQSDKSDSESQSQSDSSQQSSGSSDSEDSKDRRRKKKNKQQKRKQKKQSKGRKDSISRKKDDKSKNRGSKDRLKEKEKERQKDRQRQRQKDRSKDRRDKQSSKRDHKKYNDIKDDKYKDKDKDRKQKQKQRQKQKRSRSRSKNKGKKDKQHRKDDKKSQRGGNSVKIQIDTKQKEKEKRKSNSKQVDRQSKYSKDNKGIQDKKQKQRQEEIAKKKRLEEISLQIEKSKKNLKQPIQQLTENKQKQKLSQKSSQKIEQKSDIDLILNKKKKPIQERFSDVNKS